MGKVLFLLNMLIQLLNVSTFYCSIKFRIIARKTIRSESGDKVTGTELQESDKLIGEVA